MRKGLVIIILSLVILILSILFAQLLGGYLIYNLLTGDNLTPERIQTSVQPVIKKKVLRLEPIPFYTLQVGIFPDAKTTQSTVNSLVKSGFRPFVSSGPPYKIWLGCFSENNRGKKLEEKLRKEGYEVFIGEGMVNDRALKFPGNNTFMKEEFAPLLGQYNIIISHSLKMFKSPGFSDYKLETWEQMVNKLQEEINMCVLKTNEILEMEESKKYNKYITKLLDKVQIYSNNLTNILKYQNDLPVLSSQGQLLEVIAAFHKLINSTNSILGTD